MAEDNRIFWNTGSNIESLAEQGDPKAQLVLGWRYYVGDGVAQDKSLAMKWYEKAAKAGLPEAERLLELIGKKSDSLSIADLVISGIPPRSRLMFTSKSLFLVVILAAVIGISYHYWPKNQQSVLTPEKSIVTPDHEKRTENDPNLHVNKASTSANNVPLVPPVKIESGRSDNDKTSEPNIVLAQPSRIEPEHNASTKKPESKAEVIEQKTVVERKSSVKDANSIPTPKTKFEVFTEQADKWLEEPTKK